MKIAWIAIGSILLGTACGIGLTWARFESGELVLPSFGSDPAATAVDPATPSGALPKVAIDHENFDFGTMERGQTQSHAFIFTNEGDAPLKLEKVNTTCKCTLSKVAEGPVAPGQSVEVVLEWTPQTQSDYFRQTATIGTNDPRRRRVELHVSGRVRQLVVADPEQLVISALPVDKPQAASVRIFSFHQQPLEIFNVRMTGVDSPELFELRTEPLSAEQIPEGAQSGQMLHVDIRPGLPVGAFRQKIELETNIDGHKSLVIPIEGMVVSPISIFGRNWDAKQGVLVLDDVDSDEGLKHQLTISVRGEHAAGIEIRALRARPDVLQVTTGEPKRTQSGASAVTLVPLTIEIPPGTPPMSRMGQKSGNIGEIGEIILETNHPQAEKLRLLVRFAVVAKRTPRAASGR